MATLSPATKKRVTNSLVTAWSAGVGYVDKGVRVLTSYDLGWRFKTDRSNAAVTLGPRINVLKPEESEADIDFSLADFNIAGEFSLTDWFGLRGSVGTALNAELPVGDEEFEMKTTRVRPAFGASLDFDGCDVDFMFDPVGLMNGDEFWTGQSNGWYGAMMSARFDI